MLTGMFSYWSLPTPTLSYWCTSTKELGTPKWLVTFIHCKFVLCLWAVKTGVSLKIYAAQWATHFHTINRPKQQLLNAYILLAKRHNQEPPGEHLCLSILSFQNFCGGMSVACAIICKVSNMSAKLCLLPLP